LLEIPVDDIEEHQIDGGIETGVVSGYTGKVLFSGKFNDGRFDDYLGGKNINPFYKRTIERRR
jgi:hypothetical protein